ncbi:MAG: response regulator [Hyphomicrobiaceae bacterium]
MRWLAEFVQSNKDVFDIIQAVSTILSLLVWTVGSILLVRAWRRNAIKSIGLGPISFRLQEEAVKATASAIRTWDKAHPNGKAAVDLPRIRETVSRAFAPDTLDRLIGQSILWVDDHPQNNMLAVRAMRRLNLDIEQVLSTETALEALHQRRFNLVISDMGRGANLLAGYELLAAIRQSGNQIPFFIFAGSDTPEFRRQAAEAGAQLSTNDMIELMDCVITTLGKSPPAHPPGGGTRLPAPLT